MLHTQSQRTEIQYRTRTDMRQILLQPPKKCLIPVPARSTVLQCSHQPAHGHSHAGTTRARGEDGTPEIGKEGEIKKYILLSSCLSRFHMRALFGCEEFPVSFITMNQGPSTCQGGQLLCAAGRRKEGSTTSIPPHAPQLLVD